MRLIIAGFAIMLLSLFAVTAPSASPDDNLSVVTAPADVPSDSVDQQPSETDVQPIDSTDVDADDEETAEMACLPRYQQCYANSSCCSGVCKYIGHVKVCN